ncbi:MAG: hypothetical protein U0Z44_09525 [Kouleothrix sp.]
MFSGDKPTITFAAERLQEEAKQDLTEVVEFLKFPDKFAALGVRAGPARRADGRPARNRQDVLARWR